MVQFDFFSTMAYKILSEDVRGQRDSGRNRSQKFTPPSSRDTGLDDNGFCGMFADGPEFIFQLNPMISLNLIKNHDPSEP